MFEWIVLPQGWIALVTLVALEIVLGIDNIIFISILVARLPESERNRARRLGILLAMASRLLLLFSIVWVMSLVEPWFSLAGNDFSGRDIILIVGGLFLLGKSTLEIHSSLEVAEREGPVLATSTFMAVLAQICILDVIFSLDSVITAVGLVQHTSIMVIAVVLSVAVMLVAAKSIGEFIDKNPTIKMLALSFLILIGVTLVGEGFDMHVAKAYIYFAMAFSVGVEMLNIRIRKNQDSKKVQLDKKIQ
ncbi:TerC family protein [Desulfotalea psychrophila]|uniref:Conserved hypothetical membrane protein n=1 Tax=Desulfotalea psychrophila (strain LSv54 / DSM 12343) TaxID=177439 RepID=Q6ARA3_DESPS|nr:TerC family protein [Desulfotalea psychrophila]CAG35121.1 conserved hypothetical membrane protein [Desulfotalea psychrophila LSv54]